MSVLVHNAVLLRPDGSLRSGAVLFGERVVAVDPAQSPMPAARERVGIHNHGVAAQQEYR